MGTGRKICQDGLNRAVFPPPIPGDISPIQLDFTDTSARIAVDANRIIRVVATQDCYVKLGAVTVAAAATTSATAGSWPLFAGVPEDFDTQAATYIAAIRVSVNGQLTIQYLDN